MLIQCLQTVARKKASASSFDIDALDYFARAEALGGSFDQSAVNATYTATYVKTAISNFISGCKTDGVWNKLTECYLLAGVSFDGLTAKLKYDSVATLTNTNFVSGDYVAAGSGSGLKGDGSTKYLGTGFTTDEASTTTPALTAYLTEETGDNQAVFGAATGSGTHASALQRFAGTNVSQVLFASGILAFEDMQTGAVTVQRTDNSTNRFHQNDGSGQSNAKAFSANAGSEEVTLLARSGISHSSARVSFGAVGSELTDSDVTNIHTRVNDLMTALGTNTY